MKDLNGKTAVITGAASGIGLALARRAAQEGMRLVLADIDEARLGEAAASLPGGERTLLGVDVSRGEDVQRLADEAFGRYGAVHLLFNNAGVALARPAWEHSEADWSWLLGVDLWGVIHAVRIFVPRLIAQGQASRIVNTASVAGFLSTPGMAAYNVAKHGVVTLSETLHLELVAAQAPVGVSVLCPAWVPTDINRSERNRPGRFGHAQPPSETAAAYAERMERAVAAGRLSAADVAAAAFAGVAEERFYILPHRRINAAIQLRMEDVLQQRNPTPLP